jgi:DNA helicase-2/ATP-dependent DNA helicase PcrA
MEGPLLIVAGAGSGKTRTLVHRVAWLIDQGIEPSTILLLTFTRKAAEEMLTRCEGLVGGMVGRVAGGTFHSLANSILRVYAPKLGFSNRFVIMDRDDSETMIGRLRTADPAASRNSKFPKRSTIQNIFSQTVNKELSVTQLIKKSYTHLIEFEPALRRIHEAYQRQKIERNLMDFDDLLLYLERLMVEHENVRQEIASRFTYILVDEYQDTNAIQARLTAHLGLGHLNVTAVGDEAQSIYAFRGANFKNILDFPKIFTGTKILKLEENYRSHPQILFVANHLLGQAKESFEKVLRPVRGTGPLAKIMVLGGLAEEAATVCDRIEADLVDGLSLSDIAVLFRASSHSFELEAQLNRRRMPFTKFGGRKFLELAHTKDFLAYLRLSVNDRDEVSLRRVLANVNGLGPKGQERVAEWALAKPSYLEVLGEAPLTKEKARPNLAKLRDLLVSVTGPDLSPRTVTEAVFLYYAAILPDLFPDDHPDRLTDLQEIKAMTEECEDLVAFLADMALSPPNNLIVSHEEAQARGDLTLSTIHSAKGLEWPRVYVISAVEGRFPSAYAKPSENEEELRLMYVAVTRARDRLTITMPIACRTWGVPGDGGWGPMPGGPSRYLANIDPSLVDIVQETQATGFAESFERLSGVMNRDHSPAKITIEDPRAHRPFGAARKASQGERAPEGLTELNPGLRVRHPGFGLGTVLEVSGGTAKIDFDQFGEKKVMIRYSRLTAP